VPFELTIDGQVFRTDELTLAEAETLEVECGRTWLELNPVRSAKEFRATARLFLARTRTPEEASTAVAGLTIGEAMKAVKWVADDLPDMFEDGLPKAGGGNSTTTSPSSPDLLSGGLPT
jgi:hypothetical protein